MTLPDRILALLARSDGLFTDAGQRVAASIAVAVGYPDVAAVQSALRCLHGNGLVFTPTTDVVRLTSDGRAAVGLPALVQPDVGVDDDALSFFVPGRNVIVSTAKNAALWRDLIADSARNLDDAFDGPLAFEAVFFMPRPKNFPKIKSVPMVRRPLLYHLERACFDGLRGTFFTDDAQVTDAHVCKRYASRTQEVGVRIVLREATWDEESVA